MKSGDFSVIPSSCDIWEMNRKDVMMQENQEMKHFFFEETKRGITVAPLRGWTHTFREQTAALTKLIYSVILSVDY